MSSPTLEPEFIARMTADQRWKYFQDYAVYSEEAPPKGPHYHIRVGSKTLYSDDISELRDQFENYVRNLRRSYNRKRGKS